MDKKVVALATLIILATAADAARVGVVIEYPNGTVYTECARVNTGTDGYQTLEETRLDITWSPAGMWGHGLCGIEGVGCPSDNCFCSSDYWGFSLTEHGKNNWEYMPVGFDAPSECWNHDYNSYEGHYCAQDGDVIGLAYGPWGTQPDQIKFVDICGPETKHNTGTRRTLEVSFGAKQETGKQIDVTVKDNNTGEGIKDSKVEVYDGVPGASKKVFEGETNKTGGISFVIDEPGDYKIRISKSNYPHDQLDLHVEKSRPATTSSMPESTITTMPASTTSVAPNPSTTTTVEATTSTIKLIPPKPSTTSEATTTLEGGLGNILGFAVTEEPSADIFAITEEASRELNSTVALKLEQGKGKMPPAAAIILIAVMLWFAYKIVKRM